MLEAKNADADEKYTFEHGEVQIVNLTGMTVGRATFRPGWRWSTDVGPVVGTSACQLAHQAMWSRAASTCGWTTARNGSSDPATLMSSPPATTPGSSATSRASRSTSSRTERLPWALPAGGPDDDAAVRAVIDGYGGALPVR